MSLKKLISGICLNIFVIPGSGQAAIKQKKRGFVFGALVVLLLIFLVGHVFIAATDQLSSQTLLPGSTDVLALSLAIKGNVMQTIAGPLKVYITLLIAVYFASVLDLVFIYKKANSPLGKWIEEQKKSKQENSGEKKHDS